VKPIVGPSGAGCGFEVVCTAALKTKPAKAAASPYEKCALTMTQDKPQEEGGPRKGEFSPEITQNRTDPQSECCYKLPRRFCGGGRPLRGADGPVVAPMVERADWLARSLPTQGAARDDALAARWLREASFEHASVASFARASLQLLALGAPPELLADVHRAALDEIAHACTFLALAVRRGAADHGPGPLAVEHVPLGASFEAFVVDTFLDGCVAETISGLEIRARADDGDDGDEVERAAIARIADDEERHAEIAWKMLAWGVRAGGERACVALTAALREIDQDEPVVRDVVLPCARALLSSSPSVTAL
jgi:hypothetical protein